jgi:hypothetical protein
LLPALKAGNNLAVSTHLNAFKERGVIKHDRTLRIPSTDRIPALTRTDEGYNYILTVLTARLKQTFDNMNLKRGMNEDQIITLGEEIINESHEDNLSMEDVLLFLQQLMTGKAGRILDRMDIPLFFELFENYRQDRHMTLQYIQYEAECNYRGQGDRTRTSDGRMENDANTHQVMANYYKQQQQQNANNQTNPVQQAPAP